MKIPFKTSVVRSAWFKNSVRCYNEVKNYGIHLNMKPPEVPLSFGDFVRIIERLGIEKNDCIHVFHSAGNLNLGFNPYQLIEHLQKKVGENGNIIMLATPFLGRTSTYLEDNLIFNVEKDSAQGGLISELFRRKKDVHRTIHPLSSNVVWGKNAKELALRQKDFEYAYSGDSIYGYGDEVNAKIIGLGIGINSVSPLHYYETLKKDEYSIYTSEKFKFRVKTQNEEFDIHTYALNPRSLRNYRNFKNAMNAQKDSIYFMEQGRLFYTYRYATLKTVTFDLIERNKLFKRL
jgi:aminoglycoside N3'-acetyltransferase